MRTPGNVETQFAGVARVAPTGAGRMVRTVRNKVLGATFQNITAGSGFDNSKVFDNVVYDGSHFFAWKVNNPDSCTSSDGLNWTINSAAPLGFNNNFPEYAVATNGAGTLIASHGIASTTNLWRSTNHGTSWVVCGAQPSSALWLPVYGNGIWMAIVGGGAGTFNCITSVDDGLTWQTGGTMTAAGNPWNSLAFGNGMWIACSSESINGVSLDNGATWFQRPSTVPGGYLPRGIYFNKKLGIFAVTSGAGGGYLFYGSGPTMQIVTGNPAVSGSDIKSVNGWIAAPAGRIFSPATGLLEGNSFYPNVYGNGYYVKIPTGVGPQPDRATEPLISYQETVQ